MLASLPRFINSLHKGIKPKLYSTRCVTRLCIEDHRGHIAVNIVQQIGFAYQTWTAYQYSQHASPRYYLYLAER